MTPNTPADVASLPDRWYVVDKDGIAALRDSHAAAVAEAEAAQRDRPERGPHIVTRLAALAPAGEGGLPEPYAWGYTNIQGDKGITLNRWDRLVEGYTEHALYTEEDARRLATTEQPGSSVQGEAVRKDWQKRCLEVGFEYWRAPDSHGVECTHDQAKELLEDLLGVEVEFTTPPPAPAAEQGHTASGVFAEYPDATDRATFLYFNGDGDVPVGQEVLIHLKDAQPEARGVDGEALARRFHEVYERLAPSFGYETRTETRAFDPESANGRLMIAVCGEVCADHARIVAAAKFRGDNHAETLRSIARMNPATEGERMKQWARDGLSGYTETAEATLAQQMDRAQAAESELAALRARVEAAPVGRVPRAKVGDLLLMSVSHDMGGKRVRLLIEEESNAVR